MSTVSVSDFVPTLRRLVNVPIPMLMEEAISRAAQEFMRRSMVFSYRRSLGNVKDRSDYTLISDSELNTPDDVFKCHEAHLVTTVSVGRSTPDVLTVNDDYRVKSKDVLSFLGNHSNVIVLCVVETKRNAKMLPEVLIDDWVDGICSGAAAKLLTQPDSEWADGNLAAYHERQFTQAIVDARREALEMNPELGYVNPVRKRSFI